MPRYPIAIYVRHPRTGTYHSAAVEAGYQLEREGGSGKPGERLPREAFARTLCRLTDPDFTYGLPSVPDSAKRCGKCS